MSNADDIVTQLQEVADSEVYRADISVSKLYEAIDEIERLRAEVKALKSMISPAPNPEYRYFVHPDAASTYAQLLAGEFND
jgi:hypothetical protein